MDDDERIKAEVMHELEWDPQVDAAHIGVSVAHGAVTLTGHVGRYSERLAAVRAAERIYGVRAVADELEVELHRADRPDDSEIAHAVARTLRRNRLVPDTVEGVVENGSVTLRGSVRWNFQRDAAERAIRGIRGVTDVKNEIAVRSRTKPKPEIVERLVAEAIERAASLEARRIRVTTSDGTVHLYGHVHSLYEKQVAEDVVKSAPGVTKIDNKIVVVP